LYRCFGLGLGRLFSALSEDVVDCRLKDVKVSGVEVVGGFDMDDIVVDAADASKKVVPTPKVRIFDGD
jgi:hypothetical protein